MVGANPYPSAMAAPDTKKILWANVQALMLHHYKEENLTRLARDTKCGPGTASRIKAQRTSVGIDVLDKIAGFFRLQPWQLLVPELDAESPQTLAVDAESMALLSKLLDRVRAGKTH